MPAKKGGSKKKKDANAPKRANSAYMFYCNAKRESWKKKNPDAKNTEVMKGLAGWWSDATEDEKKPFVKMAEDDKKRYEKEKANYTPAEPSGDESGDDSDDAKGKRKRKTKAKKDPNAPKRAKTAFFCFADSVRDKLRKANPELKMTEISTKIGAQWKALDDDKKAEFEAESKELKKKYEKEKAAYDKSKKDESEDEEAASSSAEEPAPKKGKKEKEKKESSSEEEESD